MKLKFNDITIGQRFETEFYKMDKDEIISFYSLIHNICMSMKRRCNLVDLKEGLHTICVSFKLWTDLNVLGDDLIAGTGIDQLKFVRPVFPDVILYITTEVIDKQERREDGEVILQLLSFKNDRELVLKAHISALVSK